MDTQEKSGEALREKCVEAITVARKTCLEHGVSPDQLGDAFMEEALLAWMMHGLSEHDIHERVMKSVRQDLREWFYRARLATGQCDCVREVHMEGMSELRKLLTTAR